MLSIEALTHFLTNKRLSGLRMLRVKIVQIRLCQGFQKLGDMWWLCAIPGKCSFINCVSKMIVLFRNKIWQCEKTQTFYYCFYNYPLGEAGLAG